MIIANCFHFSVFFKIETLAAFSYKKVHCLKLMFLFVFCDQALMSTLRSSPHYYV